MATQLLVVASTNDITLRGLRNAITRLYPTDATVTLVALLDANLAPVFGTNNLPMAYVAGTSGGSTLYRGTIPSTVPLVVGATYTARVLAVDTNGNVRTFDKPCIAVAG